MYISQLRCSGHRIEPWKGSQGWNPILRASIAPPQLNRLKQKAKAFARPQKPRLELFI